MREKIKRKHGYAFDLDGCFNGVFCKRMYMVFKGEGFPFLYNFWKDI